MLRIAVMIVLAADLLVCPIRCGIHASGAVLESASAERCAQPAACCCDCEGRSPTGAGDQPISQQPLGNPDCCCEDCLCDGAILPDVAAFEVASPLVWFSSSSAEAGAIPARFGGQSLRDINPPPKPGGSDARALYQSWQI